MKFKLDENLPKELAEDFRAAHQECDSVEEEGLKGSDDPVVLSRVQRENRVLLTMDRGIGNIRKYPPEKYSGLVVFRPRLSGRLYVMNFVRKHIPTLIAQDLKGHLIIITETGFRVR